MFRNLIRPQKLAGATDAGRDWCFICEVASFEAICAPVEAGIAVSPMLASTVTDNLEVLEDGAGLPRLTDFLTNLYLPRANASDIAVELARHMSDQHMM